MKYKFDMVFHIKESQNMVRYYLDMIFHIKEAQNMENYLDMIFHLKATIWKLFWHDFPPQGGSKRNCRALSYYERDFDMIFHLKLEI